MKTIKLTLADAPTDVLVYLVNVGPQTAARIGEHFDAIHEGDVTLTVANALGLLEDAKYARYNGRTWTATASGIEAVTRAEERAR